MTTKPAKPSKEVVYLDIDEDIASVIEKLESSKHKIIALVLPKRFTTLQSIVNMRLLARSAEQTSKNVVLITSDPALLPLAGAAGLHVAKDLQSKPEVPPSPLDAASAPIPVTEADEELDDDAKLDYHRSVGALAAAHAVDDSETIPLEDEEVEAKVPAEKTKKPKDKKLKIPDFDRFRLLLVLGIAALAGLIIFIILAVFVLPKATINIETTSSPLSANFTMTTSGSAKELQLDKDIIPGELKKADQSITEQARATGKKNLGEKASGKVTLTNCSSTGAAVTVPAGTGITSGGLTFITQESAQMDHSTPDCDSVPGFTSEEVSVVAQSGGEDYNIGPSSFTVAGYSSVKASSSQPMSGGTDRNVTVVSQQDVDKVRQKLTTKESDDFSKKLQSDLAEEGYYVVTSTLKLSDPAVNASPAVGQQAANSTVTVKINYSVLVVKKEDLQKAVRADLEKQIDKTKQKVGAEDVLKDVEVTVENQKSQTDVTLKIKKDTVSVPIIDEQAVKKMAAGLEKGKVRSSLENLPGVTKVDVHFSPFWVSSVPKNAAKVKVITHEVEQSNGEAN